MLSLYSAALASSLTIAMVLTPSTVARVWPWSSETRSLFLSDQISNSQDLLSTDEIGVLFLNLQTLDAYSQRPDCFRNTVVGIRTRCGESEMSEAERVRAAISMTLCELATAKHHLPPLECFPFSSPPHEREEIDEDNQSICVGALSRSAQFWSSYSGYLREVPQLCFAYRRWHDIDTSKSIYLNATLEKLALIRLLKQRETRMTTLVENWAENISDLRTVSGDLYTRLFEAGEHSHNLVVNMESTVMKFQENLADFLVSVQKKQDAHLDQHTSQFNSLLQHAAEAHTESLLQVVTSIDASLTSRIEVMHDTAVARINNLFLSLSQLDEYWERMTHEITILTGNAIGIADITNRASAQLESNLELIFSQQHLQSKALVAVQNLTRTVAALSSVAHIEMQRLNDTARNLHNQLSPSLYLPMHWLKICARFLVGVNPAYLDHLSRLPVLHFLIRLISLSWSLLQLLCTFLMSLFIVRVSRFKSRSRVELPHAEPLTGFFDRAAASSQRRYSALPSRRFVSRIPARLYMPTSASCSR